VEEYLQNRSMRERAEFHEGQMKRNLMEVLEEAGDHEGNSWTIELDEGLPYVQYKGGKPLPKTVTGIERRERVSTSLDEEQTLKLLESKGLLAQCTSTITVVDEDAILAANYAGQISDKELADLYSESSTFAFHIHTED
jgi:hypothetical protein